MMWAAVVTWVYAGRVSPVHRGAAAVRQGVLVHVVQPAGGQAQAHQEARETHVHGGGTTRQGRTPGPRLLTSVDI